MCCTRYTFLFHMLATPATYFSWQVKIVSVADDDTTTVLYEGHQKRSAA